MLKKILLIAAALVAIMAAPAGAQASGYSGEDATATISDSVLSAGESVTVSGTCDANDSVPVTIGGVGVGSIDVNDDDTFSGSVITPDLPPGDYVSTVTCGDNVLSADVTIVASGSDDGDSDGGGVDMGADGDSGTGGLARTGSPVENLAKVGGGLVLAGAAVTLFATRRRQSANRLTQPRS